MSLLKLSQFKQHILSVIHACLNTTTCIICGAQTQQAICAPCYLHLPTLENPCDHCAQPRPADYPRHLPCGQCLQHPPCYDRVIALAPYQTPYTAFIPALKFFGNLSYARLLGELLTEKIKSAYQDDAFPDTIIPVPLHRQRLRQRGFNQAIEIAKPLAKQLNIPLLRQACIRTIATHAQLTLPLSQRKRNVKNAFHVVQPFEYQHVAILDDVVTSGHTVAAVATALKKAGIKRVDVWCCARALIS